MSYRNLNKLITIIIIVTKNNDTKKIISHIGTLVNLIDLVKDI